VGPRLGRAECLNQSDQHGDGKPYGRGHEPASSTGPLRQERGDDVAAERKQIAHAGDKQRRPHSDSAHVMPLPDGPRPRAPPIVTSQRSLEKAHPLAKAGGGADEHLISASVVPLRRAVRKVPSEQGVQG